MTPSRSARRGQRAAPNALILIRNPMATGVTVRNRHFRFYSENVSSRFAILGPSQLVSSNVVKCKIVGMGQARRYSYGCKAALLMVGKCVSPAGG
jgi:hypothetical protein